MRDDRSIKETRRTVAELNIIQDVANNVHPREVHTAVCFRRVVFNHQITGVRPVNIHLEVWRLNARKSYNSFTIFQPTGRASSAEELRCGAYHIFVDSETMLIRSNQGRDDSFMAVARSRLTSCMAHIWKSANLGRLEARSLEVLFASKGRFAELSLTMDRNKR